MQDTAISPPPLDIKKKPEKVPTVQYYVKFSFTITYILLMTTATITIIEALRTKNAFVRHVLNLETCISIVAGYFYSVFTTQIDEYSKTNTVIDWGSITSLRYIDWSITTPLMLLTLAIVLSQNAGKVVYLSTISMIVGLNYLMLFIGYLGETNKINRLVAMILGYFPFFGMFYLIYVNYVKPRFSRANNILFGLYLSVWGLYGLAYLIPEEFKNITMNILDLIAKCLIGLGLWAYYTKILH
jgi:sensory rhodopsin